MRRDGKRLCCSLRDGHLLAAAMGRCIAAEIAMYVSKYVLQLRYGQLLLPCSASMFSSVLKQGSCCDASVRRGKVVHYNPGSPYDPQIAECPALREGTVVERQE